MMIRRRRALLTLWFKARPGLVLTVLETFLSYAVSGCLSNRYVIPPQELARLARLPPQTRADRVLVVQALGDRRSDAIAFGATAAQPPGIQPDPAQPDAYGEGPSPAAIVGVEVGVNILAGPPGPPGLYPGPHPSPGFDRSWPAAGSIAGRAPAPASRPSGGTRPWAGGGGRSGSLAKTGAGGRDESAIFAIIMVVLAVLAVAGLAVTEGARYDGAVQMYAGQPVHLTHASGAEWVVALGDLMPADAEQSVKAEVMDDEGWGLRTLGRRPLDRQGFAFKLDMGYLRSLCPCSSGAGVGSDIQFGYFPHHRLGVLANLSLGGDDHFERHAIAGELQWFPLDLGRFYLGAFGHAGVQYAKDSSAGWRSGPALGAGLILELSVTTRLTLMVRGDWTAAHTAPDGAGWSDTVQVTGGLAVY
jgi:hypothetical protein